MKRYKLIFLITLLLAAAGLTYFTAIKTEAKKTCCGKCTGSANCTACKNCKYCAYCNSGGSCGVCASSSSYTQPETEPGPTYTTPAPKASKAPASISTNGAVYTVLSKTLNIRSAPSTSATVLATVKQGEQLIVLSFVNAQWAKVKYGSVVGYAVSGYLKG